MTTDIRITDAPRITQAELSEINDLERELPLKRLQLASMKENLLLMLRAAVPIEPGRFDAEIAKRIGRPVPRRRLLVERVGQPAVDAMKRVFKATVWYEAKIREYATLPLWNKNSRQNVDSVATECQSDRAEEARLRARSCLSLGWLLCRYNSCAG